MNSQFPSRNFECQLLQPSFTLTQTQSTTYSIWAYHLFPYCCICHPGQFSFYWDQHTLLIKERANCFDIDVFTVNTSIKGRGIIDQKLVHRGYFYNTYNMHVVANRLCGFISTGRATTSRTIIYLFIYLFTIWYHIIAISFKDQRNNAYLIFLLYSK